MNLGKIDIIIVEVYNTLPTLLMVASLENGQVRAAHKCTPISVAPMNGVLEYLNIEDFSTTNGPYWK